MATAIVSGRVDAAVKERAGVYIRAAGSSVGDVINDLWTYIARTKSVPHFSDEPEAEASDAFAQFMAVRAELLTHNTGTGILDMNNAELKEYLSREKLKDYEALS